MRLSNSSGDPRHFGAAAGADQVILLGTAHGFPGELLEARIRELNEGDIEHEASWGVLGPASAIPAGIFLCK